MKYRLKIIMCIDIINTIFYYDTLPYKEYGKFKGKVKFISSNSITYENCTSLYSINGSIENKEIYSYKGVPNELKIGMSANVSIITDKKKIIYYLLEKLNIKKQLDKYI